MSMTSKVNPALRVLILEFLGEQTYPVPNSTIQFYLPINYSLRAIQEATQKLTREGVLVRIGTFYKLAPTASASAATTSGN